MEQGLLACGRQLRAAHPVLPGLGARQGLLPPWSLGVPVVPL